MVCYVLLIQDCSDSSIHCPIPHGLSCRQSAKLILVMLICLGYYVSVNKLTLVLHHLLFVPHVTVLALKSHGIPGAVMTR